MYSAPKDVAQIRLDNALVLFEEFVSATIKHPDAATLRGLERRFAERLQIQPSYWSQIKGRSRQIGERLARQFEQLCHKPIGWMDQDHSLAQNLASKGATTLAPPGTPPLADTQPSMPQDDDERFIVGLVLTYYRRHPQRARTRLLDLLGEVLTPPSAPTAPTPALAPGVRRPAAPAPAAPAASAKNDVDEWRKLQQAVAPLKNKR
ncbi:hypothetical protein [Roseateles toxinivorans]|uniref:Uncharacterized protein n=1 Tax=Roseateles toxinivorans TaxID=270368 RepID=A0A4R6QR75_9BURK|nr:hypothetical protein [Roseateles toxinivorans]TDP73263.1 hypothetical protein DES47_1021023 [Roseateles toxinivorans]